MCIMPQPSVYVNMCIFIYIYIHICECKYIHIHIPRNGDICFKAIWSLFDHMWFTITQGGREGFDVCQPIQHFARAWAFAYEVIFTFFLISRMGAGPLEYVSSALRFSIAPLYIILSIPHLYPKHSSALHYSGWKRNLQCDISGNDWVCD